MKKAQRAQKQPMMSILPRRKYVTIAEFELYLQLCSQGLSSLPPLSLRKKETLVQAGHVALVDKHFPTGVVFSLFFDLATGRKRIRFTRHVSNQ